jgi:ABC-type Mn2+/Zn2+ transport system permease subunit
MSELLDTVRLFAPAFLGSLMVAVACAILGVYVIGRRLVLVGVALPQVAAAGIGLSFLAETVAWTAPGTVLAFARDHDLMAVLLAFAGLAVLLARPGRRRMPVEVGTGAGYCLAAALAVLFVQGSAQGMDEVRHLAEGEILGLHGKELLGIAAVLGGVLASHAVLFRRFLFASFDPEMAATLGIRTRLHDLIFYAGLAVAVARSVTAAGTLFVFAFLLLPGATGLLLARRVGSVFAVAAGAALAGSAGGFLLACRLDWPVGPTAATAAFAILLLAAAAKGAADRLRARGSSAPRNLR